MQFEGNETYIASEVLLLAQDGLISIELCFELRDQLLDALLVRRQNAELLEHSFHNNAARNRFKLCILDARRLLEFRRALGSVGSARVQTRASRCSGQRRAIRTARSRRLAAQRGVRGRATMMMERATW